ncbi:MAG TPA: phosphoribosyltransferase [Methylocella sp.]|nr:phosphoribosyltransferase [Methylocella sp.]
MFDDRADAGRKLAARLSAYKGQSCVLLALPRGGVPVAAEVASVLGAPIDLVLVRKIGVPSQPELAMGAIADGASPLVVRNEDVIRLARVSECSFETAQNREWAEIERRRGLYLGDRKRIPIAGRIAIVIDDGIATGATTKAALKALRQAKPKRLILAVPVGPVETIEALRADADEVIVLEAYEDFGAIGHFYNDFAQVSDQEVRALLARHPESGHDV